MIESMDTFRTPRRRPGGQSVSTSCRSPVCEALAEV